MFTSLAHLVVRARWVVLAATVLFIGTAAVWGTGVFGELSDGGFDDPDSESSLAASVSDEAFGHDGADVVLLYRATNGTPVDDPTFQSAVEEHVGGLPSDAVSSVTTPWSTGPVISPLRSEDGQSAAVVLTLAGYDRDERAATYAEIADQLADPPAPLEVQRGGDSAVFSDVNSQVGEDIARAESVSTPLLLVLLVLVFGGLVAASLPLAIGAVAILGSFLALRLLTGVTEVSVFSVNVVIMLGLGLAIDYALFVVSRFREELATRGGRAAGPDDVRAALAATLRTAGRTVAVSGLTVAISLSSLLLFPQMFLRSMGLGGMAAVLIAMVGALTVLPALLAVLGPRVDSLRLVRRRRPKAAHVGASGTSETSGAWARIARAVMRRPLVYVAVIVPGLLLAGSPFLQVEFGGVDHRSLPDGTESRSVVETLDRDFPGGDLSEMPVLVAGGVDDSEA